MPKISVSSLCGRTPLSETPGHSPIWANGQSAVLTAALDEALAQDYDGLLRIAPAVPASWDVDGTVFIQHQSQVHAQIRQGLPVTVAVDVGADYTLRLRNPWPGQDFTVLDQSGREVVGPVAVEEVSFDVSRGSSYVIQRAGDAQRSLPFAPVSGTPASSRRRLGGASIGLAPTT